MRSLWQPVHPRLSSPAGYTLVFALVACWFAIQFPPFATLIAPIALLFLVTGMGAYRGQRWAAILGVAVFALLAANRAITLALYPEDFSWGMVAMLVSFTWIAFEYAQALRHWATPVPASDDPPSDSGEKKPFISMVLLLRKDRYLEAGVLARIVEEAWGGDYTNDDEEARDGFVVGDAATPIFILSSPHGIFMIHNEDAPYWEDTEDLADEIDDLRLRKAVLDHHAWCAVDLLAPADDTLAPDAYYPLVVRLLIEFADDDTLAVLRPETGQINIWNDDVYEALLRPRGLSEFSQPTQPPVIHLSDDDPALVAARDEARRRWPEFRDAFALRSADDLFTVKAGITVDDETEFIWIEITGLEPDFIHGTLANDPVDLGDLALGSRVEVPLADLSDWAYTKGDGPPIGLFSAQAVNAARSRKDDP